MTESEIYKRILENQLAILNMLTEPYDDDSRKLAYDSIRLTLRALSEMERECKNGD